MPPCPADRQPFVTTLYDGTPSARMIPRNITGNFLVGNYGGGNGFVALCSPLAASSPTLPFTIIPSSPSSLPPLPFPKNSCVDNDDGSLLYETHSNLLVYGHQKFKVGGIKNFDNIMAYVTDFAGHWDALGELGYAPNGMSGNRVIFAAPGATYHDCSWTGTLAHSNALYGAPVVAGSQCKGSLTLTAWQELDPAVNDVNSSVNATLPLDEEIMGWARELLMG